MHKRCGRVLGSFADRSQERMRDSRGKETRRGRVRSECVYNQDVWKRRNTADGETRRVMSRGEVMDGGCGQTEHKTREGATGSEYLMSKKNGPRLQGTVVQCYSRYEFTGTSLMSRSCTTTVSSCGWACISNIEMGLLETRYGYGHRLSAVDGDDKLETIEGGREGNMRCMDPCHGPSGLL